METRPATFTARGATLAYGRLGSGAPLVLLNGYAATKADWDPTFLERLGDHSELLCPDTRGVGDSEPGTAQLTVELLAADVVALLDELGIDRAPVLGWSMGGFVAQQLAATAPDRVEALVLLATDHGGPRAIRAEPAAWERLLDHTGSPREQATRLIHLLFPEPPAGRIDAEFGEVVARARAELSGAALRAQEELIERWHADPPDERLAEIRAPALCAAGSEDVVIPPANTELLAAALPGSWRASFPGAGHALMAQEPARLARLIGVFLGR